MYIVLGANGHVGSAVANRLLSQGKPVTVVTHDATRGADWEGKGAQVAVADVRDVLGLREVLRGGERLFMLNPPAPPSTDAVAREMQTVLCIIEAIEGSGIRKVVAESTYGAQPGDNLGDLGVLYDMEQRLAAIPQLSVSVIRAAYYMSNWDAALQQAREQGVVHAFFPPEFRLPMVAPHDLGLVAARLLAAPIEDSGLHYVEGPQRYGSADVAAAFARALDRPVQAVQTPAEQWIPSLMAAGFSQVAAQSMAAMTQTTLDQQYDLPEQPERGATSLQAYIDALVAR